MTRIVQLLDCQHRDVLHLACTIDLIVLHHGLHGLMWQSVTPEVFAGNFEARPGNL
jgi:hypothetical protein